MRLVDARCVALVAGQVPLVWREEEGQYFPSGEGASHCSCNRGRLFAYVAQPSLRIGSWGGRAAGELALVVLREALGGGLAARLGGDVVALADEEGGIVRGEPVDVLEEAVAAPYSEQAQVRQHLGAPPPVVFPQKVLGVAAGLLRGGDFNGLAADGAAPRSPCCLDGFYHRRW